MYQPHFFRQQRDCKVSRCASGANAIAQNHAIVREALPDGCMGIPAVGSTGLMDCIGLQVSNLAEYFNKF